MDLDPKIAHSIVTSLKDVINHEINLFDTMGCVIASTDESRVGTRHEAARIAAMTQKTVPVDNSEQFRGARHGINVPVLFNEAVVAVVGITGNREDVESFGTIIGKMTEILIRENHDQVVRFDELERYANLMNLLVLKRHDHGLVDYLASVLGIDLTVPRRALVGKRTDNGALNKSGDVYPILYAHFAQEPLSFFSTSENEVRIFTEKSGNRLSTFARDIQRDLEERLRTDVCFGIGSEAHGENEYWRSYDHARRALDWTMFTHDGSMRHFQSLDAGIVFTAIPDDESTNLVRHVFGDLPDREIDDYQLVFDAYTRHNGSIKHCSEELFLHKNTLQNRLNKIARVTGYNPRELADYTVLSIAFTLRSYLRFKTTRP